MTLLELFTKYEFHDSLLNKIEYTPEQKTLIFEIDFCYFMQKEYNDGEPENGIIKLIFNDVENYNNITGEFDMLSILETKLSDNKCITFNILNDVTNDFYELSIETNNVDFVIE